MPEQSANMAFPRGPIALGSSPMSSFDESDAFEAAVPLSQRAMTSRAVPYLDGLNPAQREAVEALEGPVLMLAGAGTGKTRALTARIAHLLFSRTAQPNEILAVTFTNKAAREMKTRVGTMLGGQIEGVPWLGTFHSICVKLLRRHAELVCLPESQIVRTDQPPQERGDDPYAASSAQEELGHQELKNPERASRFRDRI